MTTPASNPYGLNAKTAAAHYAESLSPYLPPAEADPDELRLLASTILATADNEEIMRGIRAAGRDHGPFETKNDAMRQDDADAANAAFLLAQTLFPGKEPAAVAALAIRTLALLHLASTNESFRLALTDADPEQAAIVPALVKVAATLPMEGVFFSDTRFSSTFRRELRCAKSYDNVVD